MEALVTAADLIAAGDVDRMVVVSADDAGPAASDWVSVAAPGRRQSRGAVAALLCRSDQAGDERREVRLDLPSGHDRGPIGHLGLLEWLQG
jgi:3-oxoacyl-[acyl-carrier-protein] synthase-1/3-oxoacyl-[acyl-carrier-protein] synthase II